MLCSSQLLCVQLFLASKDGWWVAVKPMRSSSGQCGYCLQGLVTPNDRQHCKTRIDTVPSLYADNLEWPRFSASIRNVADVFACSALCLPMVPSRGPLWSWRASRRPLLSSCCHFSSGMRQNRVDGAITVALPAVDVTQFFDFSQFLFFVYWRVFTFLKNVLSKYVFKPSLNSSAWVEEPPLKRNSTTIPKCWNKNSDSSDAHFHWFTEWWFNFTMEKFGLQKCWPGSKQWQWGLYTYGF